MEREKKVLLIGGSSYIGKHLVQGFESGKCMTTYYKRPVSNGLYFDLLSMDLSEIIRDPEDFSHAVILSADPQPDSCALDKTRSYALNVDSTKKAIDYLASHGIRVVFSSSEFVFDGEKGNYVENDSPNPILTYGHQKVEVENYIRTSCDEFLILRLAKVFGSDDGDGTLFTSWINDIKKSKTIRCAQDQIFSPIHVNDVVNSIIRLIELGCQGIYHLANPEPNSRLELLQTLIGQLQKNHRVTPEIITCSIRDFDLLEPRPLNVSMDPSKLIHDTGLNVKSVEEILPDLVLGMHMEG